MSFALVKRFSQVDDVSVGFLMQIDKLVHLLESPIFVHLRLKLLDVESKSHAPLLKSIYGILLCLPQGDAFRLLNNRLTAVCNLRDNLGLSRMPTDDDSFPQTEEQVTVDKLLQRYDQVREMHKVATERQRSQAFQSEQEQALGKNSPTLRTLEAQFPEHSMGNVGMNAITTVSSRHSADTGTMSKQGRFDL